MHRRSILHDPPRRDVRSGGPRNRAPIAAAIAALALACRGDEITPPAHDEHRLISGRLVPAGDVGPLNRVRVTLRLEQGGRAREFSGFADVDGTFRFDADLPATASGSLDLIVDVVAGARPFAPVYKRIAVDDSTSYRRPLLIATNVTISSGTYTGSVVPVALDAAFAPICADAASGSCLPYFGHWRTVPVLWPEDAFPIPTAFFRSPGEPEISAADSSVFWANVDALETEFGRDLFRPVDIGALGVVTTIGLPQRGNAVSLDRAASPAFAGAWAQQGRLIAARARVNSAMWLNQRYVMNHELIHVLGFGHTCSWPSLVCGVSQARPSATRGDVAAFLLAYLIDRAVRTHAPTTTVEDALAGKLRARSAFDQRR